MAYCDGCGREDRKDVKACGRDSNGDPDAPDMCFLCRKESQRGKLFSHKEGRYVYWNFMFGMDC